MNIRFCVRHRFETSSMSFHGCAIYSFQKHLSINSQTLGVIYHSTAPRKVFVAAVCSFWSKHFSKADYVLLNGHTSEGKHSHISAQPTPGAFMAAPLQVHGKHFHITGKRQLNNCELTDLELLQRVGSGSVYRSKDRYFFSLPKQPEQLQAYSLNSTVF